MMHYLAKRAQLLTVTWLHAWWGTSLLTLPYPHPFGGLEYLVGTYGPALAGSLLVLSSLCACWGLFRAYWQQSTDLQAIAWLMPQEVLVLQMALGALALLPMAPVPTRTWYTLGYALPLAVWHTVALVDFYRRRHLEHVLRERLRTYAELK